MTAANAVIQGILQGLTEFLPVSSSGHLALFQYFTGQNEQGGMMFTVFLHMGTLLAVFIAFYKTIWGLLEAVLEMAKDAVKIRSKEGFVAFFKHSDPRRRMIFLLILSLLPLFISLFFVDFFDRVAADNDIIAEGGCFIITSILLFLADGCPKGRKTAAEMKYRDALLVGAVQAVAPMPGISRSGSTISAGLLLGLEREFAVAFSFIMGIPPVLGANIMESRDALAGGLSVAPHFVLIGVGASLLFGLLSIFMVKWLVKSERFKIFAYYTLVLGVLVIGVGIFERLTDHMIQDLVIELLPYAQKGLEMGMLS